MGKMPAIAFSFSRILMERGVKFELDSGKSARLQIWVLVFRFSLLRVMGYDKES